MQEKEFIIKELSSCSMESRERKYNMKKNLQWRLSKLPTPDEVRELVRDKIITQEEAREILFNESEKTDKDVNSLKEEIKFLRELVEKLSNGKRDIIIKEIEVIRPYYEPKPWYNPYITWCSGSITNSSSNYTEAGCSSDFKDINTF